MKKYFYTGLVLVATTLAACTGDYTDWDSPVSNSQLATAQFGDGSVTEVGTIDMAALPDDATMVQACQVQAPTATDTAYNSLTYKITMYNADLTQSTTFDIQSDGTMTREDLEGYVVSLYGKRPVVRTIYAYMEQWIGDSITAVKTATSGRFKVNVIPEAPEIDNAYYMTGSLNATAWDNTDTTYKLVNGGGDVYDDPVFTITIDAATVGDGIEFKLTPESGLGGDWSKCITAAADGTEGKLADKNAGGNLKVEKVDGALSYKLSCNLLDQTYTVTPISYQPLIYYVGTGNGWDASAGGVSMKLARTNASLGIYTGYVYCKEESYGNTFRFLKTYGDWNDTYGSDDVTTYEGDIEAGPSDTNFSITGGTGLYYIEMNLSAGTIKATKITNMNLVGGFNGWNQAEDAQQMTWNAADLCFEKTGAGVTSDGWKFTANNEWTINLGGELDNLESNGANISVAGTTIKLYPCRTTSDNIFATVE